MTQMQYILPSQQSLSVFSNYSFSLKLQSSSNSTIKKNYRLNNLKEISNARMNKGYTTHFSSHYTLTRSAPLSSFFHPSSLFFIQILITSKCELPNMLSWLMCNYTSDTHTIRVKVSKTFASHNWKVTQLCFQILCYLHFLNKQWLYTPMAMFDNLLGGLQPSLIEINKNVEPHGTHTFFVVR